MSAIPFRLDAADPGCGNSRILEILREQKIQNLAFSANWPKFGFFALSMIEGEKNFTFP
jgi:hypothetical protein